MALSTSHPYWVSFTNPNYNAVENNSFLLFCFTLLQFFLFAEDRGSIFFCCGLKTKVHCLFGAAQSDLCIVWPLPFLSFSRLTFIHAAHRPWIFKKDLLLLEVVLLHPHVFSFETIKVALLFAERGFTSFPFFFYCCCCCSCSCVRLTPGV